MPNLSILIDKSKEFKKFHKERLEFLNKHFERITAEFAAVELTEKGVLCEDLLLEDIILVDYDMLYNYLIEFQTVPDDMEFVEYVKYLFDELKAELADWCLYAYSLNYLDGIFQDYWNGKQKDFISYHSLVRTIKESKPSATDLPTPKEY